MKVQHGDHWRSMTTSSPAADNVRRRSGHGTVRHWRIECLERRRLLAIDSSLFVVDDVADLPDDSLPC
ncbi:MAG: hypothetical protein KDA92_24210, partial [Planctomycetales bacterium]|nr:hypothetical protein [Planctomycetales bacterium]